MGNKPVCSLWELGKGMTAEEEQRYVESVPARDLQGHLS